MRKFGKESTAPDEGVSRGSGNGWLQNHGALAVCIIALLALVLRVAFAYGVSADGDFALSGGSDAQYHLHVVESILDGSIIFGTDAAVNYPVGGLNVNPPLYDFIAAGVGAIGGASFALAVLAPIFGALTVFPVYLVGKELSGVKVGVLAALIYALMALPIQSSVFSNGTEFAFTAFLFAFFVLAMIKMAKKLGDDAPVMKQAIIAGVLLGLIALSWNGFRSILVLLIIVMVVQLLIDRFNSKDFSTALYSYSIVMVLGVAIAAVYYIPAGLWDAVFSGPVLITVTAVLFGFIFKVVQSKPWIFTVPALIVAYAILAVVLFLVNSDLGEALLIGNSVYTNSIMSELTNLSVSISTMSSYYGWILMWMPFVLGLIEFYIYARKDRSNGQLFLTMLLLIPWFFAWTSYGAAVIAGPVFAVSSAIVIAKVFEKADLKTYWTNIRNAGFPGCFRKLIKPLPFVSVLVTALLVIAPGLAFSVDAGISSNETYGYFAYGNTTYTIQTGDDYPMTQIYDDLTNTGDKDLAVLSWINGAADIEALGFNTVNDRYGDGASAAAHIYLADGAAGASAAQIVRVMYANPDTDFSTAFGTYSSVYSKVASYIADPELAKETVLFDTSVYGKINSDITEENAVYFASVKVIADGMSTVDIMKTYDKVCSMADENIGYYIIDGSMVPLVYGDGDSLSTMAYFAGYSVDSYGAASEFYSLITYYSNYFPAVATDALYDTFMWKALIGPSPEEMGYSSSFSYLYDLTTSNGSVKTMPGYGLAGYELVSWYVKYNADATATTSDDGWEYMTYDEASALQTKDGGIINYLSSIMLYKYTGLQTTTMSSVLTNEYGEPLAGITVQVTGFNTKYDATTVFSETTTDADGKFTIQVPQGDFLTVFKNGSVKLSAYLDEGAVIIPAAEFHGSVYVGDNHDLNDYKYTLEADGKKVFVEVVNGEIRSENATDLDDKPVHIVPGTYTYSLIDGTGTSVASGTVTLYEGENSALMVSPKTYTITATVTDFFGRSLESGTVIATNATTYEMYSAEIENGKAVITVPAGTYTVSMSDGYVCNNSTTLTVSSNRSVSITAYEAIGIEVQNAPELMTVYGGDYSELLYFGYNANVPYSIGATAYGFTFYGVTADKVYWGVYTGGSDVTISSSAGYTVKGSIGSSGTVSFVNGSAVFTAKADSEGKFSIVLPATTFSVFAYNDSNGAYVGTLQVSKDTDMGDITTESGRKISVTYQYKSGTSKSNVGLPYSLVTVEFKYGNGVWTWPAVTDSSGKATFVIPEGSTDAVVYANGGSIDNDAFKADDVKYEISNGTGMVLATITLEKDDFVKNTVYADYEITLTPYGEEDEISYTGPMELVPGEYTAKINANTGYYFDGTVYVYPGDDHFSGLNPIEVYGVEITKYALDELEITGDKSHNNYNGDDVYYFEYDCEYYLATHNPSTGYMRNGYLSYATGETPVAKLDMSTVAMTSEIQGFVGAIADGTVEAYYDDIKIVADVTSGSFTIEVPKGTTDIDFVAHVTKTVSGQKFGFSGSTTVSDVSSGIVNIPVTSDADAVDYEKDDLDARIEAAVFEDGRGHVTLTIYNNTDSVKGYAVTAGSSWILDQVAQVTLQPHTSETLEVVGTYEQNGTGIGSVGISVIVSDFNGTTSKTLRVIDGDDNGDSKITMKTAATSDNKDKLSGSEYLYALTFVNEGQTGEVTINADVPAGYSASLMSEGGEFIKPLGSSFTAVAQSTTIVYVKIMKLDGDMDKAPSISVSADVTGGSVTLNPSSIDIEVESMTVSGDTAVDEKSGVPMGVWFILGVSVLLLILIVWMGSKRGGVFSRR